MYDMPLQRTVAEPRVDLEASVHILSPDRQHSIRASTANISESGMFVRTAETWVVNSELHCDLSLPSLSGSIPVRGRVAWVQDRPTPGVGIRFIELDPAQRDLLRQAIASTGAVKPREQRGQPVKVWFERLTYPMDARATQTSDGILLRYALPHLLPGSRVVVYPSGVGGAGLTSVLEQAYLEQTPDMDAPQLCVQLREQPGPEDRQAHGAPAMEDLVIEPVDPDIDEPVIELSPRACPDGDRSQLLPPDGDEPYSLTTELELLEVSEPLEARRDLEAPDPRSFEVTQIIQTKSMQARRPSQHLWLWCAALLMTGLTISSMLYTNLWDRLYARYQRWSATAGMAAESTAGASQPATRLVSSPPDPQLLAPPPARSDTEPSPSIVPDRAALPAAGENEPRVLTREGRPCLVIPIRGSIDSAEHYPLANPDGIVVNLPRAKPRAAFGTYRFKQSTFRMLWIRRRENGVHLRVLFRGQLPDHALNIEKDRVQVTLIGPP